VNVATTVFAVPPEPEKSCTESEKVSLSCVNPASSKISALGRPVNSQHRLACPQGLLLEPVAPRHEKRECVISRDGLPRRYQRRISPRGPVVAADLHRQRIEKLAAAARIMVKWLAHLTPGVADVCNAILLSSFNNPSAQRASRFSP
jgi:hypothetical protein